MASQNDRKAAVMLLLLAAAGLLVRFWEPPGSAPGAVAYRAAGARPERDSIAARALRLARPLQRGERIDLDVAPAEELARLPRVGPALAARIVNERAAHGPFGSLESLDRVPGIGPTLLDAIRPHAAFSGRSAGPADPRSVVDPVTPPRANEAGSPLIGPPAPPEYRAAQPPNRAPLPPKVSLNTATEAELEQLPGIGPALARAILADRAAHGPYGSLEQLRRVRGVGNAILHALKDRILVP